MGEVVDFDGETTLPIEPDRVLKGAVGEVKEALVLGWDNDGVFYMASSMPDIGRILVLLEIARRQAVDHVMEEDP